MPKIRIYRFMSAEAALNTLETGRLRIGRLVGLNDPFDCRPHFGASPNPPAIADGLLADAVLDRMTKSFNESLGLLCFTRTWNEPLLWAHYAAAHSGVALVFDWPD